MSQKKAQKIRINTTLELDGVEYNVSLAPVGKKAAKKMQKTFNKEKEAFSSIMDVENDVAKLRQDLGIVEELIEVEVDLTEKKAYILEKRDLLHKISEKEESNKKDQESSIDKLGEITEKMYESMFDEMVSGDDVEALKAYVSDFSYKVAVEKIVKVYDEEIATK